MFIVGAFLVRKGAPGLVGASAKDGDKGINFITFAPGVFLCGLAILLAFFTRRKFKHRS